MPTTDHGELAGSRPGRSRPMRRPANAAQPGQGNPPAGAPVRRRHALRRQRVQPRLPGGPRRRRRRQRARRLPPLPREAGRAGRAAAHRQPGPARRRPPGGGRRRRPCAALGRLVQFHVDFALSNPDVIRVQDRDFSNLAERGPGAGPRPAAQLRGALGGRARRASRAPDGHGRPPDAGPRDLRPDQLHAALGPQPWPADGHQVGQAAAGEHGAGRPAGDGQPARPTPTRHPRCPAADSARSPARTGHFDTRTPGCWRSHPR